MRRPPSSASSAGGQWAQFDPFRHIHAPLPQHIEHGLRNVFQLLDTKGEGQVPFGEIRKKWPVHFAQAPVPANFLDCLRRVIPSSELVTIEHFMTGARLALSERMSNGRLKRVQSEGKLLGSDGQQQNENRPKSRTSTPSSHPAMGLSGRKMDPRDFDRLARLKRASRSQPQLNDLEERKNPRGLRRTNCLPENKFNFNCMERGQLDEQLRNDNDDVKIVYRAKKAKAPAPPPPSKQLVVKGNTNGLPEETMKAMNHNNINNNDNNNNGRRPISVASTGNCSTILPPPSSRISIGTTATTTNGNNYAEELQPQVAKHERLLEEEFDIVRMGAKNARELLDWFNGRTESLEKRRRMLNKGMVALDSAVHEQKLNFHRAQIAEINRRIKTFLTSAECGFPSHNNVSNNITQPQQPQPIRSQVIPPPFPQPSAVPSSVPNSSSNCCSSSSSSSASSPPDSNFSSASEAEFLRAQNQKLMRDMKHLAGEVEQLRFEQRRGRQPPPPVLAAVVPPYQHLNPAQKVHQNAMKIAPNGPAMIKNCNMLLYQGMPMAPAVGFPSYHHHHHSMPKDTLL